MFIDNYLLTRLSFFKVHTRKVMPHVPTNHQRMQAFRAHSEVQFANMATVQRHANIDANRTNRT